LLKYLKDQYNRIYTEANGYIRSIGKNVTVRNTQSLKKALYTVPNEAAAKSPEAKAYVKAFHAKYKR